MRNVPCVAGASSLPVSSTVAANRLFGSRGTNTYAKYVRTKH